MTPEEREWLRKLCEAATPGPMFLDEDARPGGAHQIVYDRGPLRLTLLFMATSEDEDNGQSYQDAQFIVAAWKALPALLDALDAVEKRIAALERTLRQAEALAEAGAFEAASNVCIEPKRFIGGASPTRLSAWSECREAIRALTPGDAQRAQAERIRAAREDEAKWWFKEWFDEQKALRRLAALREPPK